MALEKKKGIRGNRYVKKFSNVFQMPSVDVNQCDKKKIAATRNFGEGNSSLDDLKLKYDMLKERKEETGGEEEGLAEIHSFRQTWKVYIIKASGSIFSRFHVQA